MQPPIGISDFRKLIETRDSEGRPYLFVDKSLLIKEILDDLVEVKLFTRPRRFGKTLNLSMLHHFFAKDVNKELTNSLFQELEISNYPEYMKHQGQYPVIFLTFKDIKSGTFNAAYEDCIEVVRQVYLEHEKEILSPHSKLGERDKKDYELFLDRKGTDSAIRGSLKNLTYYLSQHYGVKPIILIDEYDTPIQTAYLGNYYQEMITFMREFLGAGLKDNTHLNKAILTGILRISKESLFSGLNNIKVYSLLNKHYSNYFGFTEIEVGQLLNKSKLKANIESVIESVKDWYNGYQIGETVLYNPWSIVNYIREKGKLSPYWVNTGDNTLVKKLFIGSSIDFKAQLEKLLKGEAVERIINESLIFDQLEQSEAALWTLLLMAGYLKVDSLEETGQGPLCRLKIPNKEVKDLYRTIIAEWLSGVDDVSIFNDFLKNLLLGNMEAFERHLEKIMLQTISVHDLGSRSPEKFYHGFILGLISGIDQKHYQINSNRESGYGRFDIIIIPKDIEKLGIIIEVKSKASPVISDLKRAAVEAIEQIDKKQYTAILSQQQIKNCLKIGIAFSGKHFAISYQREQLS